MQLNDSSAHVVFLLHVRNSSLVCHLCMCVFPSQQSSADQAETKSAQPNQPSKMIPPKQPLYTMPPQASSPYPGLGSFLSPSDLQSYRGHPHPSLSRTLSSKPMLPSISASPPPSFQISPPLHQQLSLHHPQSSILNQPLSMQQVSQQPILSPSMALQVQPPMNSSPPGQQVSGLVSEPLAKMVHFCTQTGPSREIAIGMLWESGRWCFGRKCLTPHVNIPLLLTLLGRRERIEKWGRELTETYLTPQSLPTMDLMAVFCRMKPV